jgi:autotransporter-associated beta strand protein
LAHSDIPGDNATDGGLTKLGASTLTLSGASTYTGLTTISNGTLLVNGSLDGGGVAVRTGATLSGTGLIGGTVTLDPGASLAPGNGGIGQLDIDGDITCKAGSTNLFEVNGSTVNYDVVVAGGTVSYGGVLKVITNGTFTAGQSFYLFSGAGAATASTFASIEGTPGSGLGFSFTNGILSVLSTLASYPTNISCTVSGSTLALNWPSTHLGWYAQSNAVSLTDTTAWYDIPGSQSGTSLNITINPAQPKVFYRLRYP